jgi:hypothetical protein
MKEKKRDNSLYIFIYIRINVRMLTDEYKLVRKTKEKLKEKESYCF